MTSTPLIAAGGRKAPEACTVSRGGGGSVGGNLRCLPLGARERVVSSLSRRCDMDSGNGSHDGGVVTGAVSVMTLE